MKIYFLVAGLKRDYCPSDASSMELKLADFCGFLQFGGYFDLLLTQFVRASLEQKRFGCQQLFSYQGSPCRFKLGIAEFIVRPARRL